MNETTASEHDPDRYAARFAHQAWLGLTHVASDLDSAVVSFTLNRDEGGAVHATALARADAREVRYAVTLDPSAGGPPVETAAALFVTAVEERLRSPGFKDPAAQLSLAAARVEHRRGELGVHGGPDAILAGALASHAALLVRQGQPEQALPLLDETIAHYTTLADAAPDRFRNDLERAVALRRQCERS